MAGAVRRWKRDKKIAGESVFHFPTECISWAMNRIRLLPVGKVDSALLHKLRSGISRDFKIRCELAPFELDPVLAYHAERQQFHSSEILESMQTIPRPKDCHLLGVTGVDLYVPILKYVFGEAQLGGPCAVVSFHRLGQEFYGLERDDALLGERLLKECIHEIGHTFDLRHCQDYRCAMASAHAAECIELRGNSLCESCQAQVDSRRSLAAPRAVYKALRP
jgi:archaemetzincin